jgi:hypothetical protein
VSSSFKRSPGSRAFLDVLSDLMGKPRRGRYPIGTPAADCLAEGVRVICYWRDMDANKRWIRGYLSIEVNDRRKFLEASPSSRRGWSFSAADGLRFDGAASSPSGRTPFDRNSFRCFPLVAGSRRIELAFPDADAALISLSLRYFSATPSP